MMKRSTREFIDEARDLDGYSISEFFHGYVYARWPYLDIGIGIGTHPLAKVYERLLSLLPRHYKAPQEMEKYGRVVADSYHGKVAYQRIGEGTGPRPGGGRTS